MKNETYKIRTLRDIYELPTTEHIIDCMGSIVAAMLEAKEVEYKIIDAYEEATGETLEQAIIWPDETEWVNDGECKTHNTYRFPFGDVTITTK